MSAHLHTFMYAIGATCWGWSPTLGHSSVPLLALTPETCLVLSIVGGAAVEWSNYWMTRTTLGLSNPSLCVSLNTYMLRRNAQPPRNTEAFFPRHANEEQVVLSALRNRVVFKLYLQLSFWSFIIQILLSSTRLRSESHWLQQQWPPTVSECFYPHLVGTCCQLWKVKHQALEQPEKPFPSEPLPLERLDHSGNLTTGGRGAFLWSGVLLGPHRKQI